VKPVEQRGLRADAARNRQLLIDAAETLFRTRGVKVSLDEIARQAGVNVATAYRHFANKHELAAAFLQQAVDRIVAIAEEAAAQPDPWVGLTHLLEQSVRLIATNQGLLDVLTHAYGTEWFEQLHDRTAEPVLRLVRAGQEKGVLRPEVAPSDIGVAMQMLCAVTDLGSAATREPWRRYLSLVLAGLRPSDTPLQGVPLTDAELRTSAVRKHGADTAARSRPST
jgi:AcrR family transcriptional regulator